MIYPLEERILKVFSFSISKSNRACLVSNANGKEAQQEKDAERVDAVAGRDASSALGREAISQAEK